jgi:hypothetical protein
MKRALFTLLSVAFGAACNCEGGGVTLLRAQIEVVPLTLDMGEYPIGVRAQGAFTISSIGDVMLRISDLRLEENEIFRIINDPRRTMHPADSDVLLIEARPETIGEHTAVLVVASDADNTPLIRIPIRLRGVPVPPCDDGNICTNDSFDAEKNDCAHTFADGIACSPADKCIINAVCSQGVCLGDTKVCDDQSMCTRDFCRQTDGECIFVEDTTICDDDNPCTADSCAPGGCENVSLPSGSPCDDGDLCTTQDSCFAAACIGNGQPDGSACDDNDSCTTNDLCMGGVCTGESIIDRADEGEIVFERPLIDWQDRAFLHRREVSLSDDGTFFGMDHLNLSDPAPGLSHVIFAFNQCGTPVYEFAYRPPDSHVYVSYVRREMQIDPDDGIRIVVGVRNLPQNGFGLNTTTYLLDDEGRVRQSEIQVTGAETGRSLLPDGSHIYGVVWPLNEETPENGGNPEQNLVIVREDVMGNVLWRHERSSDWWAEFLGVAGPRVLFWSRGRFGALDFNTGATVWSEPTSYVADEMALHTGLNLGVIRTQEQLHGVEILSGTPVFDYPATADYTYVPRTDPVISPDGRILVMMMRWADDFSAGVGLDWVELTPTGDVLRVTPLPYAFPPTYDETRHEDRDDPFPTVADDGVAYVGYGDQFWAINPDGSIRWTITSTVESAFTGTVPLLRDDGILLISEQGRRIIGVRTNGGQMSETGWASFRHDGRRTKFTP